MFEQLTKNQETFLIQLADLIARSQGWRKSAERIPRTVRAYYRSWIKNRKDLDERFLLAFVLIYFKADYHLTVPETLMKEMEDRGWSMDGWATYWATEWGLQLSNTQSRYPMALGTAFSDAQNYRFHKQVNQPFPGLPQYEPA